MSLVWLVKILNVSKDLISEYDSLTDHQRNDVLIASGYQCNTNRFYGIIVYVDGEANSMPIQVNLPNRSMYIGPSLNRDNSSLPVSFRSEKSGPKLKSMVDAGMEYLFLPHMTTYAFRRGRKFNNAVRRYRGPTNEWSKRPYLVAYAVGHCVPHRERTFDALYENLNSTLMHALGRCCGRHPESRHSILDHNTRDNNWHIFRNYKFVLCMENQNTPGYATEKIVNVFAAGAVPIYDGDFSFIDAVFGSDTYVSANDHNDMLKRVQKIDSGPYQFAKRLLTDSVGFRKYLPSIALTRRLRHTVNRFVERVYAA
eukprot:gene429-790_t